MDLFSRPRSDSLTLEVTSDCEKERQALSRKQCARLSGHAHSFSPSPIRRGRPVQKTKNCKPRRRQSWSSAYRTSHHLMGPSGEGKRFVWTPKISKSDSLTALDGKGVIVGSTKKLDGSAMEVLALPELAETHLRRTLLAPEAAAVPVVIGKTATSNKLPITIEDQTRSYDLGTYDNLPRGGAPIRNVDALALKKDEKCIEKLTVSGFSGAYPTSGEDLPPFPLEPSEWIFDDCQEYLHRYRKEKEKELDGSKTGKYSENIANLNLFLQHPVCRDRPPHNPPCQRQRQITEADPCDELKNHGYETLPYNGGMTDKTSHNSCNLSASEVGMSDKLVTNGDCPNLNNDKFTKAEGCQKQTSHKESPVDEDNMFGISKEKKKKSLKCDSVRFDTNVKVGQI